MIKKIVIALFVLIVTQTFADYKDLNTYIGNFNGGITNVNPYYAPQNSAIDIRNYVFDEYGLLNGRKGWRYFCNIGVNKAIQSTFFFEKLSGSYQLLASSDTNLYKCSFGTSQLIESETDLQYTNNYSRDYVTINDVCYIGDGYNENLKYGGSKMQYAGLYPPTDNLWIVVNTPSTIGRQDTGAYKYAYSFVSDTNNFQEVESNFKLYGSDVTINKGDSVYIVIPKVPDLSKYKYVTDVRLYRSRINQTSYYLIKEIPRNDTDYEYIDSANDTELPTDIVLSFGRYPYPACKYFVTYKGRLFGAGNYVNSDRVYYSNFSTRGIEPEYNELDVGFVQNKDLIGKKITGLAVSNGHLVIFTKNSTVLLYIPDEYILSPEYWRTATISKSIGCLTHYSIANKEQGVLFTGNDGLYSGGIQFTGNLTANGQLDYIGKNIKGLFNKNIKFRPENVSGIYTNHNYYLTYSDNGYYNDRVLCFSTVTGKFTTLSNLYINGMAYNSAQDYLVGGSSLKDGNIYYINAEAQYDGNVVFEDNTVDTIQEIYLEEYDDTYYKYILNDTFNTKEVFNGVDTDIVKYQEMRGQTLFNIETETGIFSNSPILDYDTNYVVTRELLTGVTTGSVVKTGVRNYILESIWNNINMPAQQKIAKYIWYDIFNTSGDIILYTYYDDESSFDFNTNNIEDTGNIRYDLSPALKYDEDVEYDNNLGSDRNTQKVTLESNGKRWRWLKQKFLINTYKHINVNRFYLNFKTMGEKWE